jgi:hypothetical protein
VEQHALSISERGVLNHPVYLDRSGFIPDRADNGKQELPVGSARCKPLGLSDGTPWLNPQTKKGFIGIGPTCAACHTGRLTYQQTTVLIDGGSALTNLGKIEQALGLSVLLTCIVRHRFERFP